MLKYFLTIILRLYISIYLNTIKGKSWKTKLHSMEE